MLQGFRFDDGSLNPAASPSDMAAMQKEIGCVLPDDYVAFLSQHDGGEGFIGEHYIIIWRAAELVRFNREYGVSTYVPEFLAFGSNGGGELIGFDTKSGRFSVMLVPAIGMSRVEMIEISSNFSGFLGKRDEWF